MTAPFSSTPSTTPRTRPRTSAAQCPGGVTVAFSTSGRAPALAGLLREAFDDLLPADIETWAARANELREQQRRDGVPMRAAPALLDAFNRLYRPPLARRAQVEVEAKVDDTRDSRLRLAGRCRTGPSRSPHAACRAATP